MRSQRAAWVLVGAIVVAMALGGCGRCGEAGDDAGGGPSRAAAPVVTADAGSLVFTWVDEDGAHRTATSIAEIPEGRRAKVRVQDTSAPPPEPGTIWLADLRKARGGVYPVRRADRAELDPSAASREPSSSEAPSPDRPPEPAADRPRVVMYMTSTCPVCRRARSWLNRNGVSYVERDIGRDDAAARELREKAARQGVRADGVPVFDVGGKLIPGFDQARLRRELGL